MATEMNRRDGRPVLRVVRGEPTVEELAALLVVILTRTESEPAARRAPGWSGRRSRLRRPLRAGAGAWRTSALP